MYLAHTAAAMASRRVDERVPLVAFLLASWGFFLFVRARGQVPPLLWIGLLFLAGFSVAVWSFPNDPAKHAPSMAGFLVDVVGLLVTSAVLITADRKARARAVV